MTVERSGRGDPQRTLALLWRSAAGRKTTRGRKPRLTVDQIVRAAVGVADADGLAATSMSRVATEVGAAPMSLYTHVPGKAELIDLMVDAALAERELPGPDEEPAGWSARVQLYAERTRAVYRHHPWLREISTVRPPLGPALLEQREYLLAALSGVGLSPDQVVAAVGAVITFVDAVAEAEADNEVTERLTGQSGDAWWADRGSFWDTYFEPSRYPAMAALWSEGAFDETAAEQTRLAFEFGLQQLFAGIRATIEANRPGSSARGD